MRQRQRNATEAALVVGNGAIVAAAQRKPDVVVRQVSKWADDEKQAVGIMHSSAA